MTKQFTVASRSKGIKCVINIQLTHFKGQAPYFSVTGDVYSHGKQGWPKHIASGCIVEEIQQVTKRFDDVIALHLSDIDGAPMFPLENSLWMLENKGVKAMQDYLRATSEQALELVEALKQSKSAYNAYIDEHLRPQWKQEAQAVISKYDLTVEPER